MQVAEVAAYECKMRVVHNVTFRILVLDVYKRQAKERADQPFMNPDEFSEALEELLGDERCV